MSRLDPVGAQELIDRGRCFGSNVASTPSACRAYRMKLSLGLQV
jgi:hypothetical protein